MKQRRTTTHERTFWLDHVEDQGGEAIQEGTPLDQAHIN